MSKVNRIDECKDEILKYKEMIKLTKQIIEINDNEDKYHNKRYLSDYKEELENQIKSYEESIKNRLFIIWGQISQ